MCLLQLYRTVKLKKKLVENECVVVLLCFYAGDYRVLNFNFTGKLLSAKAPYLLEPNTTLGVFFCFVCAYRKTSFKINARRNLDTCFRRATEPFGKLKVRYSLIFIDIVALSLSSFIIGGFEFARGSVMRCLWWNDLMRKFYRTSACFCWFFLYWGVRGKNISWPTLFWRYLCQNHKLLSA